MLLMLNIFLHNIFPLFIMILLGMLMNRAFQLDVFTLSKFNFYIFVPCFIFYQIYTTRIPLSYLLIPFWGLALLGISWLVSLAVSRVGRYPAGIRNAFLNSVLFYNSGNFGLPLITLVFRHSPYLEQAITTQVLIILVQNTTMNTLGFINADQGRVHWKESIGSVLRMPGIYAVILAFLLKLLPWRLEEMFFWPSVVYLKGGMIPMALLVLGVQLGRTRFSLSDHRIYMASFVRLILIPVFAYGLIRLFGFDGVTAQALFISTAGPTALTTVLIALERRNEPDFAAQAVLSSSLFCIFTLVVIISIAGKLFPL